MKLNPNPITHQTLMRFDLIFYMKLKKASSEQVELIDLHPYMGSTTLRTAAIANIAEADRELLKWGN